MAFGVWVINVVVLTQGTSLPLVCTAGDMGSYKCALVTGVARVRYKFQSYGSLRLISSIAACFMDTYSAHMCG